MKRNISYDDGTSGYIVGNGENVDVCFNIGTGNTKHQIVLDTCYGTTNNIRIYNNTFTAGSGNIIDFCGLLGTVLLKNNIFYSPLQRNIFRFLSSSRPPNYSGFSIDNNIYYSETTDKRHFYSAHNATLFTLLTMQSTYGQDMHSLLTNPLLVNAAALNFSLSANSPAKGTGVQIQNSPVTDFYGNSFNLQTPDAGAIQSQ